MGHTHMFMCIVVLMGIITLSPCCVYGEAAQVPCYFIFGASSYDNGNNNALPTTSKANYPPYGIDFPQGATGRFCNGRTAADVLAQLLGFNKYITSFASAPRGNELLKGVNYASAGSGIRKETGQNLGARISMDGQLLNHQVTVSRINENLIHKNLATKHLSKCLYTVGMGTNDYINNYFRPQFYPTSRQYTPDQYATVLIQQYSQQLKTLYNLGARKVALFGIAPFGCAPAVKAAVGLVNVSQCVETVNNAVQLFNTKLTLLVDQLNHNLTDALFLYVNSYHIYSIASSGFRVRATPCCQVTSRTAQCVRASIPCGNRSAYIWWDGIHQTEAANIITATRSYKARSPSDTYPIDIHTLAHL